MQSFDPADASGAAELNGVVAIGAPFGGTRTTVAGPDLREVAPGEDGQLLLSGPQVTPGYWLDAEKTNFKAVVRDLPLREQIDVPVREQLIVELYSK